MSSFVADAARVIIFSGVFDPVHNGHLSVADAALKTEGSLVIFLPERIPQHKHGRTAYMDRVNMLRIALRDRDNMTVMESPFDHHTVDKTLRWLQKQYPSDQKFGLLLGSDVLNHLPLWSGIENLASYNVDTIIIARRGMGQADSPLQPLSIEGVRVRFFQAGSEHLTSTIIRQDPVKYVNDVPAGVNEYIESNRLYISAES